MICIQNNRETSLNNIYKPLRIISLVPSQTELLVDLGLIENLVGITKFCVHPKGLKAKITQVGGTKTVNLKKIKDLKPDLIVCNKEENTAMMVEELSKFCLVLLTDIATLEDNIKMIYGFGQIFNKKKEAQLWINKINLAQSEFKTFTKLRPIKKVAYFIWKNPYMVAASGTFINEMLHVNNFDNVFKNKCRYPIIDLEEIENEHRPEILFLSSEPYPFRNKDISEISEFITGAKIIIVNGEMFSWYGTRVLGAFDYFKELHSKI